VRTPLVVITEPPGNLPQYCSSIWQWIAASVIAFERFDEGFGNARSVLDRGETWHQTESAGKVER
jgi:hypothetical protein